jgi:predicted nicotinamide N-methyase
MKGDSADLLRVPRADVRAVLRHRDASWAEELFFVAVTEFDIFTLLAREALPCDALCRRCGVASRPGRVLIELLAAMGYLKRRHKQLYLTGVAKEFLCRESPWYMASYFEGVVAERRARMRAVGRVLRTDRPLLWGRGREPWAAAIRDVACARAFVAEMDVRGQVCAPVLARRVKWRRWGRLLDVGGGSGIYSCAICAREPMLRATVLEQCAMAGIAEDLIKERHSDHRVQVCAADMFRDDFPDDHDVHLYSDVLHDWTEEKIERLLHKSCASLPSGGSVVIHEPLTHSRMAHLRPLAEYSAFLMLHTEGRCYQRAEMQTLCRRTGFAQCRFIECAGMRSALVVTKR